MPPVRRRKYKSMREYDVMKLAGHADFKTTHKYYLCKNLLQNCCSGDVGPQIEKDCQA
jgi:hypothetical protein